MFYIEFIIVEYIDLFLYMHLITNFRKSYLKGINLRHLAIWVVIWGNLAGILDYTLLRLNVYSLNSSSHLRIYFFTAIIALIISNKIIQKVNDHGHFITSIVNIRLYK